MAGWIAGNHVEAAVLRQLAELRGADHGSVVAAEVRRLEGDLHLAVVLPPGDREALVGNAGRRTCDLWPPVDLPVLHAFLAHADAGAHHHGLIAEVVVREGRGEVRVVTERGL